MKFGKKELIMSVLVVSLGVAVYVNWQFGANEQNLSTQSNDEDLGVAHYVNASITTSESSGDSTSSKNTSETSSGTSSKENSSKDTTTSNENSTSSKTSTTNTQEYFSKVRLERQQTQDELIELAQGIVEATESSGKSKEEAVKQLNRMSDIIQQQMNVENLIIAKGFDDCVAFIQNGECSVVVTGQELKSDLLIAIKDIVMGQTGISFDKIRVTHI